MPSRCIFFLSALTAWSTLLSRTRTCTLAPWLLLGRVTAKAPKTGALSRAALAEKALRVHSCRSGGGFCTGRRGLTGTHIGTYLRNGLRGGVITEGDGSPEAGLTSFCGPDARHVAHLAACPRFAFSIHMYRRARHRQPARGVAHFRADQIHHLH